MFNIRMPAAAALRGDPLAELIWHRYVADILHELVGERGNPALVTESS